MAKGIIKIKDDKQRRIVIPKDIWKAEKLERGDYIEVEITKIDMKHKPESARTKTN